MNPIVLALFLSFVSAQATEKLTLEGVLQERGTRKPLKDVTVHLLPHKFQAVTDSDGRFIFKDVPEGEFRWTVRLADYANLDLEDKQAVGDENLPRTLYLEKRSYQTYETTVYAHAQKRDAKAKTIEKEDFKAPGASNDAIKAVQNLPGATTPAFFSPALLVEGASPYHTRYLLEGFRVPSIFHFGGFATVVPPQSLERVDFLTSGYGPESGQGLGGQVQIWLDTPKPERTRGYGFVDVFNVGGEIRGTSGAKGGYLGAVRYGYSGALASAVASQNSLFSLTTVPFFSDATMVYQTEPAPKQSFKLVSVASYDALGLVIASNNKTILTNNGFFRVIPQFVSGIGTDNKWRFSAAIGNDTLRYRDATYSYFYNAWFLGVRMENENHISESWDNIVGLDFSSTYPQTTFTLPEFNNAPVSQERSSYSTFALSPYWRGILHPKDSHWTVSPGVRLDYFTLTSEWVAEPRLEIRYAVNSACSLRAAGGYYAQTPAEHLLDPSYGNGSLKTERAAQATFGAEFDFRDGAPNGTTVSTDIFYKYMNQLVALSNVVGQHFNQSGFGTAYGWEFFWRARYREWNGWLAYTLSRSTRGSATVVETRYGFDQTHALSLLAGYTLPRNWRISGRVRVLSGSPGSPLIEGEVKSIYLPDPGNYVAAELPDAPVFQMDLRIDKQWVFDSWMLALYLDVTNLTGSPGSKGLSLPPVPVLGARAEF